jgi:hypothetical protein
MSEYEEDYDEEYESEAFGTLSEEELLRIQADYRKQKLKENLIGPVISTMVHVALLVLCAIFFVGEVVEKNETVEITPVAEETPKEEPPPPPPPPEIPPPEPQEVVSHDPQVTSDAVPDAADLVGAIDDVSDEPPSTDDNAETDLVNDVKPSASSIVSSKMFGGRSSAGRAGALKSYGGSVAGQQTLHKALNWLAKVQNPDGTWGSGHPEAMTSLAILTFLAHGETPKSKNFGTHVSKGIAKLAEWGTAKNFPIGKSGSRNVYEHALVAYALSEAYAMTGNYALQEAMDNTIQFICDKQHPNGGYFYGYKNDGPSNFSNACWNWQALKAAKAAGCSVSNLSSTIEKSIEHMKKFSTPTGFYYRTDNKGMRDPSMRAVGVLCLQLLGEGENPIAQKLGDIMIKEDLDLMKWEHHGTYSKPAGFFLYWMYYATQVMFQRGGKDWKAWNTKFQALLKKNQHPEGYWDSPAKGIETDRASMKDIDNKVYSTTLSALQLTVYYRYLPSSISSKDKSLNSKKPSAKAKEKAKGEEEVNIF